MRPHCSAANILSSELSNLCGLSSFCWISSHQILLFSYFSDRKRDLRLRRRSNSHSYFALNKLQTWDLNVCTSRQRFTHFFSRRLISLCLSVFSERLDRRRVGPEAAGDRHQAESRGQYSLHADWSRHHSGRGFHVPHVSTEGPWGEFFFIIHQWLFYLLLRFFWFGLIMQRYCESQTAQLSC